MSRVDDAREWFFRVLGHHEATRRINQEARLLRVDPTSTTAIRHAIASYQAETGKSPRGTYRYGAQPTTQEGLIP